MSNVRTPSRASAALRFRLVAVLAVVVAGVATYVVLSGRQEREVPLPADSATPEQVVRTYLDALDARDCATAAALAPGTGRTWCRSVSGIDDVHVQVVAVTQRSAYVDVRFTLHQRLLSQDSSLDSGPMAWGYDLARSPGGAWRITGEGVG